MAISIIQKPSWFTIPPEGMMVQNFHKAQGFLDNKGYTMPSNKYTVTDMDVPYDIEEIQLNGRLQNPLRSFGFTMPSHQTNPQWDTGVPNYDPNGRKNYANSSEAGGLIADPDWQNTGDGNNPAYFHYDKVKNRSYGIALLDFEHTDIYSQAFSDRMRQGKEECLTTGTKIGLWGNGYCTRFALQELVSNLPTGNYNTTGAAQWVTMYSTAGLRVNPYVSGPDLEVSNIFFYDTGYYDPKLLYQVIVSHELSKIIKPSIISIPTIWQETESVDGLEQQRFEFIQPANPVYNRPEGFRAVHGRMQTPASTLYAQTLWCLLVCDGYYLFGSGRQSINDLKYAWPEQLDGGTPNEAVISYKGVNQVVRYPMKYNGFLNYVALANWQVSQSPVKEILEDASTSWQMPAYTVTSGSNVLRTGWNIADPTNAKVFPSWACYYGEPLIRYKMNAAGTKALFIAQNPHNEGIETVVFSNQAATFSETITLEGNWPTWGVITI
jgi:hypothetical protein